ncbi:MAG: secretin N-terminal domain-containing protein, partial [Verrucomicrobiota bacterium]
MKIVSPPNFILLTMLCAGIWAMAQVAPTDNDNAANNEAAVKANTAPTAVTNRPTRTLPAAASTNAPPRRLPTRPPPLGAAPRSTTPPLVGLPTAAGAAANPVVNPASTADGGAPVATTASGNANISADEPVLLNFNNTPLDQVFDTYSRLSGRTVLRPATLPGQVTIKTLTPLTPEEAVQALNTVLALNGITIIPQGEKFVKAVLPASAPTEGTPFSKLDSSEIPEGDQFITQIVKLKYAAAEEVALALVPLTKNPSGVVGIPSAQVVILRDLSSVVKRMLELIAKIDTQVEQSYTLEVIPIRYGKVTDIYETMNSLISGSGGGGTGGSGVGGTARTAAAGGRTTSGSRGGARGAGGRSGAGGAYGAGAQGGINPQTGQPYPAGQTGRGNVSGNRADFSGRLQQIVNRAASGTSEMQILGDARIVPDERSNSLIVYANKEDMKMITNIVSKVDVLLAQVVIEAVVVAVTLGDKFDAGIVATQNRVDSGKFTGAGAAFNPGNTSLSYLDPRRLVDPGSFVSTNVVPGGFSYFGKFGESFNVAVSLVASDSRANIIQRPRIQTSHAVPGSFFIGDSVPYASNNYGGGYGGYSGYSTASISYLEVGTSLEVTPFITPDGLVVLDIVQEISTFDGFEDVTSGGTSGTTRGPKSSTKSASATLSIRDGDTILLGGYISESKTKNKSGVPVLKDVPILGALFRSKSTDASRSELVILLHVTVL